MWLLLWQPLSMPLPLHFLVAFVVYSTLVPGSNFPRDLHRYSLDEIVDWTVLLYQTLTFWIRQILGERCWLARRRRRRQCCWCRYLCVNWYDCYWTSSVWMWNKNYQFSIASTLLLFGFTFSSQNIFFHLFFFVLYFNLFTVSLIISCLFVWIYFIIHKIISAPPPQLIILSMNKNAIWSDVTVYQRLIPNFGSFLHINTISKYKCTKIIIKFSLCFVFVWVFGSNFSHTNYALSFQKSFKINRTKRVFLPNKIEHFAVRSMHQKKNEPWLSIKFSHHLELSSSLICFDILKFWISIFNR